METIDFKESEFSLKMSSNLVKYKRGCEVCNYNPQALKDEIYVEKFKLKMHRRTDFFLDN